jgi:SAM-dependent methyltransferase
MNSIAFYDSNADTFFQDTVATDMSLIYGRFLPLVKPGGRILDAGCGSGRDTLAFIQRGYAVDAFDGSAEMARRASALAGIPVSQMMFEELLEAAPCGQYDGVWCCASLLHLDRNILPAVLAMLLNALVPGGAMYLSFKHGDTDRDKDGRRFTDLTEEGLRRMLEPVDRCRLVDIWLTGDQRIGRTDTWLNAVVRNTLS